MPTYPLKKLGEVCLVIAGQSPEGKFYNQKGEGLPFYQGKKEFGDKYIGEPTTWTTEITKEAIKDDILMSVRAPVGPINFSTNKICIGRGLAAIRPGENVDKNYLFNFLLSIQDLISGNTGAVFDSINKKQIEEIGIPLPPLSVQEEIVAKLDNALDSIDEAKTKTEQSLAATRELWESMEEAFQENNGEAKKLGELGQITSSKRIYKKEYVKNGIPFYRIKEIKELAHEKDISIELYISKDRYNEIKETFGIPQEGDLLMTAVGTIGEIYTVKKDDIFYFKDGNVLWFRKFNSINPHFLKLILLSFVENIKKLSIGSAYNALTIEKLENYTISIPSLTEQSRIVAHLDAVRAETDRLASRYGQKLVHLDELRRSVLQEAFAQLE